MSVVSVEEGGDCLQRRGYVWRGLDTAWREKQALGLLSGFLQRDGTVKTDLDALAAIHDGDEGFAVLADVDAEGGCGRVPAVA